MRLYLLPVLISLGGLISSGAAAQMIPFAYWTQPAASVCSGTYTWTERTAAGSRAWYGIAASADGAKLAGAAYGGYIYTSSDGGVTWTAQSGSGSRNWSAIASSADGAKLAATVASGNIYTSADSGVTWTARTGPGTQPWKSIASSSDGVILLAAGYGAVGATNAGATYFYSSTDSGATWAKVQGTGVTCNISGATLSDQCFWYDTALSGNGSVRLVTSHSMSFVSLEDGYDGAGAVLMSANSGSTWAATYYAQMYPTVGLSTDGTKMMAGLYGGYIYLSTNSGGSWASKTASGARNWSGVELSGNGNILGGTVSGGYIYISADNGTTWTAQTTAGSRAWSGMAISSDGSKIAAAVNSGYVYTAACQ